MTPKVDLGLSEEILNSCREDAPEHTCDACQCDKAECVYCQLKAKERWEAL